MKKILSLFYFIGFSLFAFAQDRYKLAPQSTLTIDGTSTVHDWTVTANTIQGTLKAEGDTPKEIDFEVAVADILSERGATMDKKMHAALQKEAHPNVLFALKEIKNEATLVGTLTIAGKPKEVEIAGELSASGNSLQISGEYGMALQEFDIEPPTAMFGQVVVGPEVIVKFDLLFKKE